MKDKRFKYYAYRTNISESRDVQELMQNGIINYEGNNISLVAISINTDSNLITPEEYIDSLITKNYNAVAIVKIPREYFVPTTAITGLKNIPIPIWKELNHDYDNTISSLDSDYIYRVYFKNNRNKLEYLTNCNYSPVVDPVGKQFDNAQLNNFMDMGAEQLYNFGIGRRKKDYDELCRADLASDVWEPVVYKLKESYTDSDDLSLKLNKKQD